MPLFPVSDHWALAERVVAKSSMAAKNMFLCFIIDCLFSSKKLGVIRVNMALRYIPFLAGEYMIFVRVNNLLFSKMNTWVEIRVKRPGICIPYAKAL